MQKPGTFPLELEGGPGALPDNISVKCDLEGTQLSPGVVKHGCLGALPVISCNCIQVRSLKPFYKNSGTEIMWDMILNCQLSLKHL